MEQKAAIVAGGGVELVQHAQPRAGGALVELARALGPARILALGAVACCLLGFFAYVISRAAETSYTLLFSNLALADAQELVGRLETLAVPFRLSPGGDAIMVPSGDALRLRMALAEDGMPTGGTVGYELFDQANPFTTSELLGNINLRRAVEGELARTIGTLRRRPFGAGPSGRARAQPVRPRGGQAHRIDRPGAARRCFARQAAGGRDPASGGGRGTGTAPEGVTLVDGDGNLLAEPSDPDADPLLTGDAEEYRAALENRLRAKVVQLLERTVGPGKADAAVSADLDFDEVATTAELYDPQSQVVRSTQTTEEASDQKESQATDAVSAANNLPTERSAADPAAGTSERTNPPRKPSTTRSRAPSATRPSGGGPAQIVDCGAGRRHLPRPA